MVEPGDDARHAPDITELVFEEHERFRRMFLDLWDLRPAVDETRDGDAAARAAAAAWQPLADLLEVHATAEEQILYPLLLTRGGSDAHNETDDAVHDHNDIRDAIRDAEAADPASSGWWDALLACRKANDEHLAEEERDVLPDLREHLDEALRRELGARWIAFHEEHRGARGICGDDVDVDRFIAQNSATRNSR